LSTSSRSMRGSVVFVAQVIPPPLCSPCFFPHTQISQWYELVIFTASLEIYGAGVADHLDNGRHILQRRYYRQHCLYESGSYSKNLSLISPDLSSIFILDNSPGAYRSYPDNAIPIRSWFSDSSDTALLCLLPVLDALRFVTDVRSILSRNLHRDPTAIG
uniref:FCP1 homology domain-containing protein n=1 Tax=Schistocephalus solidus TaxID=70667 RepID=A0A183SZI4_SCHSO